eukprot:m.406357 g.406357  ORF g.406357 m.406357 type:complete len:380 (+) comp56494_c0_seq8:996-2135(+)
MRWAQRGVLLALVLLVCCYFWLSSRTASEVPASGTARSPPGAQQARVLPTLAVETQPLPPPPPPPLPKSQPASAVVALPALSKECSQFRLVPVALRQPFITFDVQPISWRMHVHSELEDVFISKSIIRAEGNEMFEMPTRGAIYRHLRGLDLQLPRPRDPLFLDVGANIGIHALFTAALGIRTHAFEPLPKNFKVLECSMRANPTLAQFLTLNSFGLGQQNEDQACMSVESSNQGNSYLDLSRSKCTSARIKIRRLDDYWKEVLNFEQVYLMKLDVQGFEGFVLRGAMEMLRHKPPIFIFTEFCPHRFRQYGVDPLQILKDMIEYGYKIVNPNFPQDEIREDNGILQAISSASAPGVEFDLQLSHRASVFALKDRTLSF